MANQMFILKGDGDSGKSTSIKLAFEMFLQYTLKKGSPATVHYLYVTQREVAGVLKIGKVSIGIASRGDSSTHVQQGLMFFTQHKCNVVACATRLKGKPLQTAQTFANSQLKVMPFEVYKSQVVGSGAQLSANQNTANQLFNWLKKNCR